MNNTHYNIIKQLVKQITDKQDEQTQLINNILKTKTQTLNNIITLYKQQLISDNTAIILLTANKYKYPYYHN